jgi:hypothetical protein
LQNFSQFQLYSWTMLTRALATEKTDRTNESQWLDPPFSYFASSSSIS